MYLVVIIRVKVPGQQPFIQENRPSCAFARERRHTTLSFPTLTSGISRSIPIRLSPQRDGYFLGSQSIRITTRKHELLTPLVWSLNCHTKEYSKAFKEGANEVEQVRTCFSGDDNLRCASISDQLGGQHRCSGGLCR